MNATAINLEKAEFQNGQFCISDISISIEQGAYAVLMGKSGSGKTTMMEGVCGLKPLTSGSLFINGVNAGRMKPAMRGIGYVPQDGSLFYHMTVQEHLQFALVIRRWKSSAIRDRTTVLAHDLGLIDLLDRYPHQLSGGEKQRVAIGRAISFRPDILCVDEPLSALDDTAHHEMLSLLKATKERENLTAIHVTHRRSEADALADVRLEITGGQVHYSNK